MCFTQPFPTVLSTESVDKCDNLLADKKIEEIQALPYCFAASIGFAVLRARDQVEKKKIIAYFSFYSEFWLLKIDGRDVNEIGNILRLFQDA